MGVGWVQRWRGLANIAIRGSFADASLIVLHVFLLDAIAGTILCVLGNYITQ